MKFLMLGVALLLATIAPAVFATGAVEDLHAEAIEINADLRAQVDTHQANLVDVSAQHDAAQATLDAATAARDAARVALVAANERLDAHEGAIDSELLDRIEAAVLAMFDAGAPSYLELIDRHGADGAARMIAERLGTDVMVVAPLLVVPMRAEEVPAPAPEPEPVAPEAETEAPADTSTESADDSPAEASDEPAGDAPAEGDSE